LKLFNSVAILSNDACDVVLITFIFLKLFCKKYNIVLFPIPVLPITINGVFVITLYVVYVAKLFKG